VLEATREKVQHILIRYFLWLPGQAPAFPRYLLVQVFNA
jgi:hypothetical protein